MADPPPRLFALDLLRGFAVMGILLMNITAFALPMAAYTNPAVAGGTRPIDIAIWAVNFVLVDGKMRALFSMLFGASMLLVIDRANAVGLPAGRVHFRRMGWLLLIGLAHAYLIWAGDILVIYAVVGMLAFAFRDRDTTALGVAAFLFLAAQMLLISLLMWQVAALRDAALAPGAEPAIIAAWRDFADQAGIPSARAAAEMLAIYRGGYGGIVHERLTAGICTPLYQFVDIGAETLGLMLIGMTAYRSGFLRGLWQRRSYARIAAGCYLVTVPPLALIALHNVRSGFDEVSMLRAAELYSAPFRPVMMIGHAALILWWLRGGAEGNRAAARIAAVGRAAFTNYLGTSLVMTSLFYGYGLGLFGRIGRAELYLIVPAAWAAMLLWSGPWLARYRYGPFEWLWRSLARGTWQPLKKDIAS